MRSSIGNCRGQNNVEHSSCMGIDSEKRKRACSGKGSFSFWAPLLLRPPSCLPPVNETRPDLDPIRAIPLASLRGVGKAWIMTVRCLEFRDVAVSLQRQTFPTLPLKLKHLSKSQKKNGLMASRIDSPGFELFSECPMEGSFFTDWVDHKYTSRKCWHSSTIHFVSKQWWTGRSAILNPWIAVLLQSFCPSSGQKEEEEIGGSSHYQPITNCHHPFWCQWGNLRSWLLSVIAFWVSEFLWGKCSLHMSSRSSGRAPSDLKWIEMRSLPKSINTRLARKTRKF